MLEPSSSVANPIFVDGRLWGAIFAATSPARPMPADAESRISQFTELVATAIAQCAGAIRSRRVKGANRGRLAMTSDGGWFAICTTGLSNDSSTP